MRQRRVVSVTLATTAGLISIGWGSSHGVGARESMLDASRVAVGGIERLAAVRSVSLSGEAQDANEWAGDGDPAAARVPRVAKTFEIQALWPDCYLRTDTTTLPRGQVLPPFRRGFNGATNIGSVIVANQARLDMTRLMLLLLLKEDSVFSLTDSAVVGSANAVLFSGPHYLSLKLSVDPDTHSPSALTYTLNHAGPDGLPLGFSMRQETATIESRMNVDGLSIPSHVITRVVGGAITSEYWFKTIQINPPLSRADFH
jgi:hypothetical protein